MLDADKFRKAVNLLKEAVGPKGVYMVGVATGDLTVGENCQVFVEGPQIVALGLEEMLGRHIRSGLSSKPKYAP